MSSRELTGWQAYEKRYGPIGPEREDFHAAMICATIANAFRGKGGKRATVEGFMPKWEAEEIPPETLLAKWRSIKAGIAEARTGSAVSTDDPIHPGGSTE